MPPRRRHDPLPEPVIAATPSAVDLHTHTRRSDGVLEPAALVHDAAAVGVRLLALTDHDTLAGYREVAAATTVPPGLELVPGVEINCIVPGGIGLWEGELHILGLGVDPDDEAFEAALAGQRDARRTRFDKILARLRQLGMPIDDEIDLLAITHDDALGRPTVARALMARGHAESVEDAFRRLLGHGMPAYVPRDGLGPMDAVRAIRGAGGLPVLAHFAEAPERHELLRELMAAGLAGLEVHYRAWDADTIAAVGATAEALRLVPTGGTDYHGDLGPYAEAHAALDVPAGVGERVRLALREAADDDQPGDEVGDVGEG